MTINTTAAPAKNEKVQGAVNPVAAKPEVPKTTASNGLPSISADAPKEPGILPIEKRFEKFYQLERLKERRDQVAEALESLGNFHLAPTGGASVKLTDSRNTVFAITHPLVIGDMVGSAKAKLAQELAEIDSQFLL